jgi:hypothetical protein
MAKYKSRVKNKYMGSGFEGYVASARTTEGLELAKKLQESALTGQKLLNVKIDQDKDEAIEKVQSLYASGKKMEDIQAEILAGKHPDLTGKFIEKTTQFHLGKVKAAETIKTIEANKNKYDFKNPEQTLEKFYEQYLPNFNEADNSFTTGFASAFNQYKADEAIKDAEKRSVYASEKKIEEGRTIISSIPTSQLKEKLVETWDNLSMQVPNTDGSDKPNTLFTNDEKQSVLLKEIESTIIEAKTIEDLDRADILLNMDLGVGADGQPRGRITDRKNDKVLLLKEKLAKRRRALEVQEREDKANAEKEDVKNIFAEANKDNEFTDDDGSLIKVPKTYEEKLQLREKLEAYGEPSYLTAFDNMIKKDRFTNTDPQAFDTIVSDIYSGKYESQKDVLDVLVQENIPTSEWGAALTYYKSYEAEKDKGKKPIHTTDAIYSAGITSNVNAVAGIFTNDIGKLKENGALAKAKAKSYMIKEIHAFEERYKLENDGKEPSMLERQDFIDLSRKVLMKMFENENIDAEIKPITEYEAEIEKIEAEKKAKQTKYKDMGITEVFSKVDSALEEKKGLIKEQLPKPDLSFFGKDATFGNLDSTDRKIFEDKEYPKFVAKFLTDTLGEGGITAEMLEAIDQADLNQMIRDIQAVIGSNITATQIQKGINQFIGATK